MTYGQSPKIATLMKQASTRYVDIYLEGGSGLGRDLGRKCLGSMALEKELGSLGGGLTSLFQTEVDLLEGSLTLLFLAPL